MVLATWGVQNATFDPDDSCHDRGRPSSRGHQHPSCCRVRVNTQRADGRTFEGGTKLHLQGRDLHLDDARRVRYHRDFYPGVPDQLPPGVNPSDIPDTAPGTATPGVLGDGCTGVPDSFFRADFYPACETHDACYSADGHTHRFDCDNYFLWDLLRACAKAYPVSVDPRRIACNNQATNYYGGVRAAGWAHYEGQGSPL